MTQQPTFDTSPKVSDEVRKVFCVPKVLRVSCSTTPRPACARP